MFAIVGSCVLILGGIALLNYNKMEPVVQSARDADILNSDNLIAKINAGRAEKGLSSFMKDTALIVEARKKAENGEGVRFATLRGDYYSTEDYLENHQEYFYPFVEKQNEKIGAWVTYVVESEGEKPVAYVVVIIK